MTGADPRSGLFVGSIAPDAAHDAATAVEIFLDAGRRPAEDGAGPYPVPAVPLGETDDYNWIDAQLACMDNVGSVRRVKRSTFGTNGNYTGMPLYVVRRGRRIDPDELDLRFATRASEGFPVLQSVAKSKGVETPRLQIGINTVDVALFALLRRTRKEIDAFVEATRRETAQAYEITGGNVFFLVETPCAVILANMFRGNKALVSWFAQSFAKLVAALPEGAGWGFHFCYGDLSNASVGDHGKLADALQLRKLIYKPERTVDAVNVVLRHLEENGLVPELVQYPFAFGRRPPSLDPADYAVYRRAYVPDGTKVFAGAIHHSRTADELGGLFDVLDDVFGQRVGMSNSCGFGRHDAAQMFTCLDHMAKVAYV